MPRLINNKGSHTPAGREPTVFSIQVLEHVGYDLAMKAYRLSRHNQRLATQLESWRDSITRVTMAYEITVYPLLAHAEEAHAKNPLRDPHEHGPASYENSINEAIRDAHEHPDKDLKEHPHRGPITLSDTEVYLLGRVAHARGLPLNPEKRIFRYTEHFARLEAKNQAATRSAWRLTERAITAGILRDRREIEDEIRQRQEAWKKRPAGKKPPRTTPRKPRK